MAGSEEEVECEWEQDAERQLGLVEAVGGSRCRYPQVVKLLSLECFGAAWFGSSTVPDLSERCWGLQVGTVSGFRLECWKPGY